MTPQKSEQSPSPFLKIKPSVSVELERPLTQQSHHKVSSVINLNLDVTKIDMKSLKRRKRGHLRLKWTEEDHGI